MLPQINMENAKNSVDVQVSDHHNIFYESVFSPIVHLGDHLTFLALSVDSNTLM